MESCWRYFLSRLCQQWIGRTNGVLLEIFLQQIVPTYCDLSRFAVLIFSGVGADEFLAELTVVVICSFCVVGLKQESYFVLF